MPGCHVVMPLNPTNSVPSFVRDGIHKPVFEGSIFQECVRGLAAAFMKPGPHIPFPGLRVLAAMSGHHPTLEKIINNY